MNSRKCVARQDSAGKPRFRSLPLSESPSELVQGMILRKGTHEGLVIKNEIVPNTFFILDHKTCVMLVFLLRKIIANLDKKQFTKEEIYSLLNGIQKLVDYYARMPSIHSFKELEAESNIEVLVQCIRAILAKLPKIAKTLRVYDSSGKRLLAFVWSQTKTSEQALTTSVSREQAIDIIRQLILKDPKITNKGLEDELRRLYPSMPFPRHYVPSRVSETFRKYPELKEIRKSIEGKRPRSNENNLA